jgi:autotransporter-associated beta strand protein
LSGKVTGPGSVDVTSGTLELTGSYSYSGVTNVTSGTRLTLGGHGQYAHGRCHQ